MYLVADAQWNRTALLVVAFGLLLIALRDPIARLVSHLNGRGSDPRFSLPNRRRAEARQRA